MAMTKEDVKEMLKDLLPKERIEKMQEAQDKGEKLLADKSAPEVKKILDRAGDLHADAVRSANGRDPLKGKGLDFVRFFKAYALAKMDGRPAQDVAKNLGYGGHIADAFTRDVQAKLKAMSEGSFADGGSLVPDQISSEFIELLRARTVVMSMGASSVQYKGSLTLNRQSAAGSASFVGESSNIPVSSPTTDQIKLGAHKLAAIYIATNELLRNPSAGAEALMRDDMLRVMALKRDLTILRDTGGSHAPKGLRYWVASANVNAIAGTSVQNKIDDLTKMQRLVEESNMGMDRIGYIFRPRTKWALLATLDSNSNPVFRAEMAAGSLFGAPFQSTTQVPSNLGGGANESEVYFGQWPELIVGEETALQIEAFPNGAYHDGSAVVSGISQDSTPIRALERFDVQVRHDTSFSVLTGVTY